MNLYLLRPIKDWEPWYDKVFGFVIRASSEDEARGLASLQAKDEGRQAWLRTTETACEILTDAGEPGVILRDCRDA